MRLVKVTKASPHAKFYNLSTEKVPSNRAPDFFRMDKYKLKIKCDKISGYSNEGLFPQTGPPKSKLLTTNASAHIISRID